MIGKWKTPAFWYDTAAPLAKQKAALLAPFAALYGMAVRQRFDLYYPVPMARPVVCVGNLVAGGAGKTPVVLSLVELLQARGYNPHLLTRGYGGSEPGPIQVSPDRDTADDVGDEALLLVTKAPTWVSKSRPLGAQSAIDTGANIIVMDDGYQNPSIYKDFSLLVIDGASGFGNGRLLPAGPLREPLDFGLARAHAVVLLGEDKAGVADMLRQYAPDTSVLNARLVPDAANPELFGKKVFAFAGIGRPEKFRESLAAAGAVLEGWGSYPDHCAYTEEDLQELMTAAAAQDALVITTAKDHVRLPPALRTKVQIFGVHVVWEDEAQLLTLLDEAVSLTHGNLL
ncbi:MAG TPA: tetraacyldisaccharide 4'-kinase [Alphaproteobacteria bacterium]|nr:tetraacyldisaccharide 4'-kinase [Alphaproteobacteria bacterium]